MSLAAHARGEALQDEAVSADRPEQQPQRAPDLLVIAAGIADGLESGFAEETDPARARPEPDADAQGIGLQRRDLGCDPAACFRQPRAGESGIHQPGAHIAEPGVVGIFVHEEDGAASAPAPERCKLEPAGLVEGRADQVVKDEIEAGDALIRLGHVPKKIDLVRLNAGLSAGSDSVTVKVDDVQFYVRELPGEGAGEDAASASDVCNEAVPNLANIREVLNLPLDETVMGKLSELLLLKKPLHGLVHSPGFYTMRLTAESPFGHA